MAHRKGAVSDQERETAKYFSAQDSCRSSERHFLLSFLCPVLNAGDNIGWYLTIAHQFGSV